MEQDAHSIRTYFKLNKIFMTSTGVWPYQEPLVALLFRFIWIAQHTSIMTAEIIKLYESRHISDIVLELIPSIGYNCLVAVLFINFIYHQSGMKEIIKQIHKNWITITEESEVKILKNYSDRGIFINWLYIGAIYQTMFIFCLFPLTPFMLDYVNPLNESRQKVPLYRVQFFVDDEKYYWTILMHAYITTTIGIIPILAVDLFVVNCTQHVCGMMLILGKRLENVVKSKSLTNKLDDSIYKDVKDCIHLHSEIFDFVDHMNYIFNTAFGILLIVLIGLTSMTGIVVLIKWGIWQDVIRFSLFTLAEAFHLFCYSYHSQDIINHNDEIYISLINSVWYTTSLRTRVLFRMMFLRNYKPCMIKCLIIPMHFENFTMFIKTTFSYFTVVKSQMN